ncbi:flavin reductase family protein [Mycolicibacterium sp. XJ1819]
MDTAAKVAPARFRHVFSHLPSGLTVIAAHGADGPVGMAANSVTSVSLDPPLLLFCPAKSSSTWPKIRESGTFCVNVMASHHEETVRQFALKDADRFVGVMYEDRPNGPAIRDAIAWVECRLENESEAGDHTIVLARVVAAEIGDATEPLVFFRGGYGTFNGPAATLGARQPDPRRGN